MHKFPAPVASDSLDLSRRSRAGGIAVLGLSISMGCAVIGCGESDRHFIMTEETLLESNGDRPLGAGCTSIGKGTRVHTGGGSATLDGLAPKYGVRFEGLEAGVRVVVEGGDEAVERVFGEAWLNGEEPAETIELQLDAERRYRVRLWGSTVCEEPVQS